MKKLRFLPALIFAVLVMMLLAPCACADSETQDKFTEITDGINSRLRSETDPDVSEIIDSYGLDVGNKKGTESLSFADVIKKLIDRFLGSLKSPLGMLGKLIAAALLCALTRSMLKEGAELGGIYSVICALAAVMAVCETFSETVSLIITAFNSLQSFMLAYIPIYAGISATLGNVGGAGSFYTSDLFLCEVIAFISRSVLLPLMSMLTAVSIVGTVNTELRLTNAASAVKRVIQWILGFMMLIFSGLMTVQTAIGASADSLRARTVRFAASSFIPIIGGAVSETYSTIKGSLGFIRTSAGTVGVVIIAVLVLRPLIMIVAVRAVLALGAMICDILGQEQMTRLLRSLNEVLAIGMSVLICFSVMFIISTCIVMIAALNTGV
ncbi:MAG: stage III sporulation protein AE [Ruminococcus sp.]|nr:stage III sporulation protein AE [Ruminococcus sp.]